jgi:hypothetical protein
LQLGSAVELYACWDGDEDLPREHTSRIRPQMLLTDRTFFKEREWMLLEA